MNCCWLMIRNQNDCSKNPWENKNKSGICSKCTLRFDSSCRRLGLSKWPASVTIRKNLFDSRCFKDHKEENPCCSTKSVPDIYGNGKLKCNFIFTFTRLDFNDPFYINLAMKWFTDWIQTTVRYHPSKNIASLRLALWSASRKQFSWWSRRPFNISHSG